MKKPLAWMVIQLTKAGDLGTLNVHTCSLSVLLSGLVRSQGHPSQSALGWDSLITSFGSPWPEDQELVK